MVLNTTPPTTNEIERPIGDADSTRAVFAHDLAAVGASGMVTVSGRHRHGDHHRLPAHATAPSHRWIQPVRSRCGQCQSSAGVVSIDP